MATYGNFPGVKVTTESGGITNVSVGEEEKLVFFGEANYAVNGDGTGLVVEGDDPTLSVKANEPEQINAPRVADLKFGNGTELAEAMKESLGNGANLDYLYGVPVQRTVVEGESQGSLSGTLDNVELVESAGAPVDLSSGGSVNDFGIQPVEDPDNAAVPLNVEFRYEELLDASSPEPEADSENVFINPLTGEYSADPNTVTPIEFSYTYNDYQSAFQSSETQSVVNENETGVFFALTDSDSVSGELNTVVSNLRNDYQLVNALSFAEPNASNLYEDSEVTVENGGADARFNTATYDQANNSVSEAHYYKFAPGRLEGVDRTIGGGLGGLFAGNPITDPIYNEVLSGYQSLEQQFSKSEADEMRDEDIIPIRTGGNVRVKGNRSTAFDPTINSVAADFWTRRITDRVILIGKQIGDSIIGRINDEETRNSAERRIGQELRQLADRRLIRPNNGEETNWTVTAYQDPTNDDKVNIDIVFSPYGIVKKVDETITVDTN